MEEGLGNPEAEKGFQEYVLGDLDTLRLTIIGRVDDVFPVEDDDTPWPALSAGDHISFSERLRAAAEEVREYAPHLFARSKEALQTRSGLLPRYQRPPLSPLDRYLGNLDCGRGYHGWEPDKDRLVRELRNLVAFIRRWRASPRLREEQLYDVLLKLQPIDEIRRMVRTREITKWGSCQELSDGCEVWTPGWTDLPELLQDASKGHGRRSR